MLLFAWASTLMMIDASSVERISIRRGEPVLLPSDLLLPDLTNDVRWTRPPDVVALRGEVSDGFRGRCELLSNGSLRFAGVRPDDSGRYRLEVYSVEGKQLMSRDILLSVIEPLSRPVMTASCSLDGRLILSCSVNHGEEVVTGWTTTAATATTGLTNQTLPLLRAPSISLLGREVNGSVLCVAENELSEVESAPVLLQCHGQLWVVVVLVNLCCFLLLLSSLFFILRKRRSHVTKTTDSLEDNLYMVMHSYHGDRRKDEEDEEQKEGVSCDCVVSMETQMTQQMSVDAEDIYV